MSDISSRLAKLSPAQRALLEKRLAKKALDVDDLARRDAAREEGGDAAAALASRPIAKRAATDDPPPLSLDQERIYFIHHLNPDSPFYNIISAGRFRGRMRMDLLNRALNEVVRRHENLRTRFELRGGAPVQIIEPTLTMHVPLIDLRALGERAQPLADVLVSRCLGTAFVLDRLPLGQALVLQVADEEFIWPTVYHHIVIDWVSWTLFQREVVLLYDAFAPGGDLPLPELPELRVQYADYAVWQRSMLTDETLSAQLDYWRRTLAEAPHVTELPLDHPRPALQRGEGKRWFRTLAADASEAFRALTRKEGVTFFMAFLALYKALVLRLTGQRKVVIGSPTTARNHPDLEPLIGYLLYHLPFYTQLDGALSFRQALARVRTSTVGVFSHSDTPFAKLVELVDPPRDPSRMPLTQLVFLFLNPQGLHTQLGAREMSGLEVLPYDFDGESSKFDATFIVWDEQPFRMWIEYNSELFDATTADRLARQYEALLCGVAGDADTPLSALPLLSAAERHQLALERNAVFLEPPTHRSTGTPPQRFVQWAERQPDATAIVSGSAHVSYGELARRSTVVASRLRAQGVGRGSFVGLSLERCVDLFVGLLGIQRAGAAYVPIDPAYPRERREFLAEDSRVEVMVDAAWMEGNHSGVPAHQNPHLSAPDPLDPAYVIYTSGSTGKPKGVVLSHHNTSRLLDATDPWFRFGPDDVWTLFFSFAFDFSTWEIWGALACGGRLVVPSWQATRDPRRLAAHVVRGGVTVLNQTPSAFRGLIPEVIREADEGSGQMSLNWVIFGGEALESRMLRSWFDRFGVGEERDAGAPKLINMYGITETTVHVTWRRMLPRDCDDARSLIGVPMPDLRLYVIDRWLGLLPLSVPGELAVAGEGLAQVYLHRPSTTAQRFVPDPFAHPAGDQLGGLFEPGTEGGAGRLYRSGDLVRTRADGDLEYLGRIDQQVKIRGFRVEVGEVEAALEALPAVRDAVVLVHTEPTVRLVAYVVPEDGEKVEVIDLRSELAAVLPDYMLPAHLLLLEALPLTSHGKVDRRALLARPLAEGLPGARSGAGADRPYVPPATEMEETLASVMAQVLGLERVSRDASFFEMGGDSLLSIRVIGLLRERGLDLDLPDLMRYPRLAELAPRVRTVGEESMTVGPFELLSDDDRQRLAGEIATRGLVDAYPLTRLQHGMLVHMQLLDDEPPFHNLDSYHLRGPFDPDHFRTGIRRAVARHPILRSAIDLKSYSEPLQLVYAATVEGSPVEGSPIEEAVEIEDLRALSPDECQAVIDAFLDTHRSRPWPFDRPPLVRFQVHWRRDDEIQLTVIENHAIFDGWSVHATLTDVFDEALQLAAGKTLAPVDPDAAPVHFRDYVALERRAAASTEHRDFWRRYLANAEILRLPRWPRPPRRSGELRAPNVALMLEPHLTAGLRRLATAAAVPIKSVLLAAHVQVLAWLSGRRDVVTGVSTNGRPEVPGGDDIRGLFLNVLPLRVGWRPDATWVELARAAFDAEMTILPHRRFPLADIQHDLNRGELYELIFNYVHFHVVDPLLGSGLEVVDSVIHDVDNFTLTVTCGRLPGSGDPYLQFGYNADRLPPHQALWLQRRYLCAFTALAADPEAAIGAASTLTAPERQQILVEWAEGPALPTSATDGTIHQHFEVVAARIPDATAVVSASGRRVLTYTGLDAASAAQAARLRGEGVGPEVPVAVELPRGVDMVVAFLAVLRAGGAYVPVEPSLPEARRQWLKDDAGVAVVVDAEWVQSRRAQAPAPLHPTPAPDSITLGTANPVAAIPSPPRNTSGGSPDEVSLSSAGDSYAQRVGGREGCRGARMCALPEVATPSLATILYTSGSTGTPKGALLDHRGLLRLVADAGSAQFLPGEAVLQLAPPGFDVAGAEIWGALLNGSRLAMVPDGTPTPASLEDLVLRHGVRSSIPTTGLFHQLVDEAPRALLPQRRVIAGGDVVSPGHVRRLLEMARADRRCDMEMVQSYGPTEVSVLCVLAPHWRPADIVASGPLPLGRPLSETRVRVLDIEGRAAAAGVPGELCLGGPGLARGYQRRPARTAEVFVPDPWAGCFSWGPASVEAGARLYRTGDAARFLPDGRLEFLGRLDGQVKIHGVRIEPGEIEAALRAHPAVDDGAVVVVGEGAEGKRLMAAMVTMDETEEAVTDFLHSRLPAAMVPGRLVRVDALPLTPRGKVDRTVLAEQILQALEAEQQGAVEQPTDDGEARVAAIFREVLGIQQIGRDDDFFRLGGHSLLATRAVSRISRDFGVTLPLSKFFGNPTPAALATLLQPRGETDASSPSELEAGPGQPLSFAQLRLWPLVHSQLDASVCNLPLVLRFDGRLRPAQLAAALAQVVERHAVLRATFQSTPEEPVQRLGAPYRPRLPVVDLSALADADRQCVARRLTDAARCRPFDLRRGPLLRLLLLRLTAKPGSQQHLAVFILHQLIADAWSARLLVHEVSTLYAASIEQRPSPLPVLALHYGDYVDWQRDWMQGDVLEQELAWWREELRGASRDLALPYDRPTGSEIAPSAVHAVPITLSPTLTARVHELARQASGTPYMVLLAAFQVLLGRWAGSSAGSSAANTAANRDLIVGTPIPGRPRPELEALVGRFADLLLVRAELPPSTTFSVLLQRQHQRIVDAHAHQHLPSVLLTGSSAASVAALFSLEPATPAAFDLLGVRVEQLAAGPRAAGVDVALRLAEQPVKQPAASSTYLVGSLEYRSERFDATTLRRLAGAFECLLTAAAAQPERQLDALPLLNDGLRHQVLCEWAHSEKALGEWEGGPDLESDEAGILDVFARQVEARPDAVALSWQDDVDAAGYSLSYRTLAERAEALAAELRAAGVRVETPVAIELERGPQLIIALLAIVQAGGTYVPVDPAYPAARRQWLMDDAGVEVVVGEMGIRSQRAQTPAPRARTCARLAGGQALLYILYTSGSTGTPKGVGTPDRGVLRLVRDGVYADFGPQQTWLQLATPSFDASTVEIWGALLHGGRLALYPPRVPSPAALTDFVRRQAVTSMWLTAGLFEQAAQHQERVAGAGLDGGLYGGLDGGLDGGPRWPTVRQLLAGGDVVSPSAVRRMLAANPRLTVIDGYGPTENSTFTTCARIARHELERLEAQSAKPLPIGRPIAGTDVYVLDRALWPVLPGATGELCTGGTGLARGYLGRPARTAEAFVPHPFAGTTDRGRRLYRTGDRVRFRSDGMLDFLGRLDRQLKLRGFRVEPGEIEARLQQRSDIEAAAVVVLGEGTGQQLVAAVSASSTSVAAADLSALLLDDLRGQLPPFLVPAELTVLPALPLTPQGKIDRRALARQLEAVWRAGGTHEESSVVPQGAADDGVAGEEVAPEMPLLETRVLETPVLETPVTEEPVTETPATGIGGKTTEEALREIFARVLQRPHVGVRDDFFALGGHSLSATQVIAFIARDLDVDIRLRTFFDHPTAEALAPHVDRARRPAPSAPQAASVSDRCRQPAAEETQSPEAIEPSRASIQSQSGDGVEAPLSFAQERLWLIERLHPGSSAYNVPAVLRLRGLLRPAALIRTVSEIVRRHQVLRSSIRGDGDGAVQRVQPPRPLAVPVVDLQRLRPARRASVAASLRDTEASVPFDLGQAPLLRLLLLRLAPLDHTAVLTVHHIASDGWSMGILVRELTALYTALVESGAAEQASTRADRVLPELELQYADFASWQRGWLQGDVLQQEIDWWLKQLQGAPRVLSLPVDRPVAGPRARDWSGGSAPIALSKETTERLRELAQSRGATLFMVLLAGFQVALGRWCGQRDLLIGSPVAGRTRAELEPLIGFFVNTIVLRGRLQGSFLDLLDQARQHTLDAHEHQHVPFARLVEAVAEDRELARSPLVQALFVLQNAPSELLRLPELEISGESPAMPEAKFELTLALGETSDGLRGGLEYRRQLFDASTMQRLLRGWHVLLTAAVDAPEAPLWQLPLFDSAQRHQLLVEWGSGPVTGEAQAAEASTGIHAAFAAIAQRQPDAIAVITDARVPTALSYRALQEEAGRLAGYLQSLGVRPGAPVGILLDRSPELILALLAVLHVGASYLPLDLSSPPARWRQLLDDADVDVVLTADAVVAELPHDVTLSLTEERLVFLDRESEAIAACRTLEATVTPDHPAYILYTSGSTGRPKGVVVPHRAVRRLVADTRSLGGSKGASDVWLQMAPVSFDASTLEIWTPLLTGGRLALLAPQLPGLDALAAAVQRAAVTSLWLTAGLFTQMVDRELVSGNSPALGRLQRLLAGGDVLSPPRVQALRRAYPRLRLINGYGPTENTTFTTCHGMGGSAASSIAAPGLTQQPDDDLRRVPIGRPIAGTQVLLLDREAMPVAVGTAGALCTGGAGLAQGYLGQPSRTAQVFLPNPLAGRLAGIEVGARVYDTGDQARFLADGTLDFLGRRDRQLKIRGFRIEPGEVEAALVRLDSVARAAVMPQPDPAGGARLVAYVVPSTEASVVDVLAGQPSTGDEPSAGDEATDSWSADLRRALTEALPLHLVPALFVQLDELPLTERGKLDRAALPVPEAQAEAQYVAPRDDLEQALADLWQDLLQVPRVGAHDSFFQLGGHSLLATQFSSRVLDRFRVDLPLIHLFEAPTVAGLAATLRARAPDPTRLDKVARALVKLRRMSAEEKQRLKAGS